MGRLSPTAALDFSVVLPLRNAEAMTNLLREITDPSSPLYRHHLTSEQFSREFAPSEADYQQVIAFAESHHLKVLRRHPGRTILELRGAVSDIETAFQTTIRTYRHPTENRLFHAPDREPKPRLNIPFLTATQLDDFSQPRPSSLHQDPNWTGSVSPEANGSDLSGYYIGNDFRAAYAPGVSLTGLGESVALVEFDGYYTNDISKYFVRAKMTAVPLTNILLNGVTGAVGANNVEVALDIDMAAAMAPGLSSILVYEGNNPLTVLQAIATDNLARQISCSWSWTFFFLADVQAMDQIFIQYALQGQTFFTASGDSGAYVNGAPNPTDDYWVTSVGGTTLTTLTPGGAWASEKVWNWQPSSPYASSGGSSLLYSIPSWQMPVGMGSNGGSTTTRNLPDVAMIADHIIIYYNNGSTVGLGGTSAAAPLWAAYGALINQQARAAGQPAIGYLNPALYSIGLGTNYQLAFHDITDGNNTNKTSGNGKFLAVPGYDLCTGWGTPTGNTLINLLSPPIAPSIVSLTTNLTVAAGGSATFLVRAAGTPPLAYQWRFGGLKLPQATNSALVLTNLGPSNAGIYSVIVTNLLGAITNSGSLLTVVVPPAITANPTNQFAKIGDTVTFSIAASGTLPLAYIWTRNGSNIAGATSSSYALTNVQAGDSASFFSCSVQNLAGMAVSSTASLTVTNSNPIQPLDPAGVPLLGPWHVTTLGFLLVGYGADRLIRRRSTVNS